MKKGVFLSLFFLATVAFSADQSSVIGLEKPSRISISSGLIYENLASENFMVQVAAAYNTREKSKIGIASGISTNVVEGETPDTAIRVFWENKQWVYSVNYNWLKISKFASAGVGYNFDLYRRKRMTVQSGIGLDIVAQQLPADFIIRTGLLSFAPRLGVAVAFDL